MLPKTAWGHSRHSRLPGVPGSIQVGHSANARIYEFRRVQGWIAEDASRTPTSRWRAPPANKCIWSTLSRRRWSARRETNS